MATVILNKAAMVAVAQRSAKPLVDKVAGRILTGAKQLVRVGDHRHGSGKARQGPSLKPSLHKTPTVTSPTAVFTSVGSDRSYAASEELGSKRHDINSSGKLLKFGWGRGNFSPKLRKRRTKTGFFLFKKVVHPGNKRPQRFLRTPLSQFGRAANFKVKMSPVNRSFLP